MHLFWGISREKPKLYFSSLDDEGHFLIFFFRNLLYKFKNVISFEVAAAVTVVPVFNNTHKENLIQYENLLK